MKKYLLLLLSVITYGQTYQNPTFGTVTTKTAPTVTTTPTMATVESVGTIGKIAPLNIPIPTVPLNYTVLTPNLGGHLSGIDTKLGSIVATTAGVTTRVWFTADVSVVNSVNYYATATTKGTATSAIQSVVNDDNQKKWYPQDLIGAPYPTNILFPPGVYAGNLSASTTPNSSQQRWTVELYKCDNLGVPIASGVTGAPVGHLGVTVITVLDSGLLTLADGSVTNVQVSGNLGAGGLSMLAGQRIRYHVSAEKVGTVLNNITQSVYYGTSYNSFLDVPVPLTTSGVQNLSTVVGSTTTDALNTLNSEKVGGSGTSGQVSFWNGTKTQAGDNALFWENSNKRLGIGSSSPIAKLQISNTAVSSDILALTNNSAVESSTNIYMGYAGEGIGTYGSRISSIGNPTVSRQNDLAFQRHTGVANNNEASWTTDLFLSRNGNVGIGTQLPDYKLSIGVRNGIDGDILMSAAGNGNNAGSSLLWDMLVAGGNPKSIIAKIQPQSNASGNALNFHVGVWNNNNDSGSAKMTILSTGNVGIGINTPTEKLHVVGNIIAQAATASNHVVIKSQVESTLFTPNPVGGGVSATYHNYAKILGTLVECKIGFSFATITANQIVTVSFDLPYNRTTLSSAILIGSGVALTGSGVSQLEFPVTVRHASNGLNKAQLQFKAGIAGSYATVATFSYFTTD